MPRLDLYPIELQNVWDLIAGIALDYKGVVKVNTAAQNGYRLENVLWTTQRDELVNVGAAIQAVADVAIDAIRSISVVPVPRPTAVNPVAGDLPEYPTGLEGTYAEENAGVTPYYPQGGTSYRVTLPEKDDDLIEDIAIIKGLPSGNNPDLPIPDPVPKMPIRAPFLSDTALPEPDAPYYWFTAAEYYRMVLRGDYFLSTPVEVLNGELIGTWLSSMYYGYIQLEKLATDTATALSQARGIRGDIERILDIRERRHKRFVA